MLFDFKKYTSVFFRGCLQCHRQCVLSWRAEINPNISCLLLICFYHYPSYWCEQKAFPAFAFWLLVHVYFILMCLFTVLFIQCFSTFFLAYHPSETPWLEATVLIKSHKHIMTQLVFLQILHVLARFLFLSCWVGKISRGVVGLGAACPTTYSAVVYRTAYCLRLQYYLFDLPCMVYAHVPIDYSQSIFLFQLHNILSAYVSAFVFINSVCSEAMRFKNISGTAALLNFNGQPVRSQSDAWSS